MLPIQEKKVKKIYSIAKFLLAISIAIASIVSDANISVNIGQYFVELHSSILVISAIIILYSFSLIKSLFKNCFRKMFHTKSIYEKGLDCLQNAFYNLLVKDIAKSTEYIAKAKKHLGELPIVLWVDGHIHMINNDLHAAKSIFYRMSYKENGTSLGAHSLYKLSVKNCDDDTSLESLDKILLTSPVSHELALQAIAICLRNKHFLKIEKYYGYISKSRSSAIKAIVCSENGMINGDVSLIKQAYKMNESMTLNSLHLARYYISECEYSKARSVLRKTIYTSDSIYEPLYDEYINCDPSMSNIEKVKLAQDLIIPKLWIGYYKLGQMLFYEEMYKAAFENLLASHNLCNYDFVANLLIKSAKLFGDYNNASVNNVLSGGLKTTNVTFSWVCSACKKQFRDWTCVCDFCNSIGTISYEPLISESAECSHLTFQNGTDTIVD